MLSACQQMMFLYKYMDLLELLALGFPVFLDYSKVTTIFRIKLYTLCFYEYTNLIFYYNCSSNSGGLKLYFPGEHEHEEIGRYDVCGKETNYTLLIMDRVVNIEAWGFGHHRNDEEFRRNNGTKFLAEFKALSEESMTGTWCFICLPKVTTLRFEPRMLY